MTAQLESQSDFKAPLLEKCMREQSVVESMLQGAIAMEVHELVIDMKLLSWRKPG